MHDSIMNSQKENETDRLEENNISIARLASQAFNTGDVSKVHEFVSPAYINLVSRGFAGTDDTSKEYFHPETNVDNTAIAESSMHKDNNKNNNSSIPKKIDIKGAITLSATIISFLMTLSLLVNIRSSATTSDYIPVFIFSIVSIVSLMLFIVVERRLSTKLKAAKMLTSSSLTALTETPLVDLNLLSNRIILINNISLMILGITTFMVYQSISVLIRSPPPLGFGGNAISARKCSNSFYHNNSYCICLCWYYNLEIWKYKTNFSWNYS